MPKDIKKQCIKEIKFAEYYNMQDIFDELYEKSKNNEKFSNLMNLILRDENILLAYKIIKTTTFDSGIDKVTIDFISKLSVDEIINNVKKIINKGYKRKPIIVKRIVKRHEPNKIRLIGISCIWDKIIEQCIKQILEPICEAKFSKNSYGFRPDKNAEDAIAATYYRLQKSNLYHIIECKIPTLMNLINHSKLIKQLWTIGIQDKYLLYVLRKILTSTLIDGNSEISSKTGVIQSGILAPLLMNIFLNEFDNWIDSNWEENPIVYKYSHPMNKSGIFIKSSGYHAMKKTKLKQMHICRYEDDFIVFCRNNDEAEKTMFAIQDWFKNRLKIELTSDNIRKIDTRNHYFEFLGFDIKVHKKGNKYTVSSKINKNVLKILSENLKKQAKLIVKSNRLTLEHIEIQKYNKLVFYIHAYYSLATSVCNNLSKIAYNLNMLFKRGLGSRLCRSGIGCRLLTKIEQDKYGKSAQLRFVLGSCEPLYPLGKINARKPVSAKHSICRFSKIGRIDLHDSSGIPIWLLNILRKEKLYDKSIELFDNKIELFIEQNGCCGITELQFLDINEIHCHHKIPKELGGTDNYENLILIRQDVHTLIHATKNNTINEYLEKLKLNSKQLAKINELRKLCNLKII